MNTPRISVIIPAHGPAEGLEMCLGAIRDQILPAAEVIVVDNGLEGGRDRVEAALPEARVIQVERRGSYAARNGGIRASKGSLLAFTDTDCEPSPQWLKEGWRAVTEGGASVVAGEVQVTASPWEERRAPEVLELKFGFPQRTYVLSQGFGVTANLMIRRDVLQRVGLFDDTLLSGGDFEWGRRATAYGHRAVFVPGALVRHPARQTREELFRKADRVSEGICRLARTGRFDPEGFLRLVLWNLSPPLVAMWRVWSDATLAPGRRRMEAMGLLIRLRARRVRSMARGMLGTESREERR